MDSCFRRNDGTSFRKSDKTFGKCYNSIFSHMPIRIHMIKHSGACEAQEFPGLEIRCYEAALDSESAGRFTR